MKLALVLIAFAFVIPSAPRADSLRDAKRDKALQGIAACLRRNEVSSKKCKHLNQDVQTLVAVYQQGDKSVLPTLLRFTYLTDFYDEALASDPEGFLTGVSSLPEVGQQAVAASIGGVQRGLARTQFDSIRATLEKIPESSPNYQLAKMCLLMLETENAEYLLSYFPSQTFAGRRRGFWVHWFSTEFYALGAKPMWPPASAAERMYRITVLPAFFPSESVALTVMPDGTGQIDYRTSDAHHFHVVDSASTTSPQEVTQFMEALDRTTFWQMPTEPPPSNSAGKDGAELVLEGVRDGKYHVVVRWCPGGTPFGKAARKLFDLSGHKSKGAC